MWFQLLIFLCLVGAAVFGMHFFIYTSILHIFNISAASARHQLAVVLAILGASMLVATMLAHWADTKLVRWFYLLAVSWLGLAFYLFFILLAARIVDNVFNSGSSPAFSLAIGLGAILLSIAIASYGAWNASRPRIKEVTVSIPGLPQEWVGRTAVQLSDMHLGYVNGSRFLSEVIGKIKPYEPDIVFLTGDMFDGVGDTLGRLIAPLKELDPPLGTFFVTGNHEIYQGREKALTALREANVRCLSDEIDTVQGLQIVGGNYCLADRKNLFELLMKQVNPALPAILLYHEPLYIKEAKAAGINLQLAGHTHQGQIFPFNLATRLVYGRYNAGMHVDGTHTIYTTSGTGSWGPPMRIGNAPEIVIIRFK